MRDLRLKQKWRSFLKRSISYKFAFVYAIFAMILFILALYSVSIMTANYDSGEGFLIEDPEQLRAIGFLTVTMLVSGSLLFFAVLAWLCSMFFFLSDQEHRIKTLEKFIGQDPRLTKRARDLKDLEKKKE